MIPTIFALSIFALNTIVDASPIRTLTPQGGKRGVAFEANTGGYTNLFSSSQEVTWTYNWAGKANYSDPNLEYISMLHGDGDEWTGEWWTEVENAINAGAKHVFSFNEPDQCGGGGACMQDVGRTIAAHQQYIQPLASQYPDVKLSAPAVTNGEKDKDTGMAMGIPFLKSFLAGCKGCKIDFVVAHWYDAASNKAYFYKHLNDVKTAAPGKQVWLTEFGARGSDAEQKAFLDEVLPWLDQQSWIGGYAYHYAKPGILVDASGKQLSTLGKAFCAGKGGQ